MKLISNAWLEASKEFVKTLQYSSLQNLIRVYCNAIGGGGGDEIALVCVQFLKLMLTSVAIFKLHAYSWSIIECYANNAKDVKKKYQQLREDRQYDPVIVDFTDQTINEIYVSMKVNCVYTTVAHALKYRLHTEVEVSTRFTPPRAADPR